MSVEQTPGWERYMSGLCKGEVEVEVAKNFEVVDWVEGRCEVRTRMSVRRLEEEYASRRLRHWMSVREKDVAWVSMLLVQIIRGGAWDCWGVAENKGIRWEARR